MLEFKINEENYFEFEMQITGDPDTGAKPIVEFSLNLTNGIKMCFLAEQKDSVYAVTLPPLKEMMVKPGEHNFTLSVLLGDKYFAPYTGKCVFKEAAKPVISNIKVEHKESEKKPIASVTFVQKDKKTLVENPVVQPPPVIVDNKKEDEVAKKKEQMKKEAENLDKLLGKKKGK